MKTAVDAEVQENTSVREDELPRGRGLVWAYYRKRALAKSGMNYDEMCDKRVRRVMSSMGTLPTDLLPTVSRGKGRLRSPGDRELRREHVLLLVQDKPGATERK